MLVRDFMSSHPACCTEQDSVRHAAQLMQQHDVGAIPVIRNAEDRKLTGIVTDRDLCCRILAEDRPSTTRVVEAMHRDPFICHSNDSAEQCMELMQQHQVRRLPVADDNGNCIGMVSQADVALHCAPSDVAETVAEISRPIPEVRKVA